jgi:hypothetical protein
MSKEVMELKEVQIKDLDVLKADPQRDSDDSGNGLPVRRKCRSDVSFSRQLKA